MEYTSVEPEGESRVTNASVERWLNDKVLLPAATTQCAVPRGIFAGTDGAPLRMIAYGQEANLVFPARPADPKVVWEQQWTVRVRRLTADGRDDTQSEGRALLDVRSVDPAMAAGVAAHVWSVEDIVKLLESN